VANSSCPSGRCRVPWRSTAVSPVAVRLPLVDAKRIVHESQAWADRRETDDRFHDVLGATFRGEAAGG